MKNVILTTLTGKIPSHGNVILHNKLSSASDESLNKISTSISMLNLKSPIVGLILGFLLGGLGIDRFYKGDIGLGIIKLLLSVGSMFFYDAGLSEKDESLLVVGSILFIVSMIFCVVDLFLVFTGIKKDNLNKVLMVLWFMLVFVQTQAL